MNEDVLTIAYLGLLHDIGKFYQRTQLRENLTETEKNCTPIHKLYGYHTHLHSGYTSKFFHNYLHLNDELEYASSSHHLDSNDYLSSIIQKADHIASSVDRNDENLDYEGKHKSTRYAYITSRMYSIMSVVDFGGNIYNTLFSLKSIDDFEYPTKVDIQISPSDGAGEYHDLFDRFIEEITKDNLLIGKPTPFKFHRMYSLLYKYTTLIPSSTYETNIQTVSLFDHLKLTSAIASCLAFNNTTKFYMLEFDISGIQKFIYHITEGSEKKAEVAKSLRGRSAFVSILTNSVTYAVLNEFKLTQANIIFNTGGGAVILLPYLEDTLNKIENLFNLITRELYKRFNTTLTLVYATEELNDKELETFKTEKALSLKVQLEEKKNRKFLGIINDQFIVNELQDKQLCSLCNDNIALNKGICKTCEDIIEISNFYTKNDQFNILYLYDNSSSQELTIDLGFSKIVFIPKINNSFVNRNDFYYLDAINHFEAGNVKCLANLVPKNHDRILNFEEITSLLDNHGDKKIAILKMDVDNLGAIFAFGLKQGDEGRKELQRSLSKYLTLSRFIELFFSQELMKICKSLSKKLQPEGKNLYYINYAGGDDLVIIGPVYGIIYLAKEINSHFQNYVQNPNITLSAGIYIQKPKKPIRFGIQLADEALEESKAFNMDDCKKHAITIINKTVSFSDFEQVIENVEKYTMYISDKNNPLSRSSFYNIMTHVDSTSLEEYYKKVPIIQYTLYRLIDKKHDDLRKQLSYELTTIKNKYCLDKKILEMKLAILFTREENNNG